jgi:hypothetical protein
MSTIIEIASIRPPKEGKKVATVVAASGQSFEIWPDKMAGLQEGARYEVEIKEREWNSRTIRQIVKTKPASEAPSGGEGRTSADPKASAADAELAFVSSTLNAFIAAGKIGLDARELGQATQLLRLLWSHTFGEGGGIPEHWSKGRASEAMNRVANNH